jgi:hypothetical protein
MICLHGLAVIGFCALPDMTKHKALFDRQVQCGKRIGEVSD